MAFLNAFFWSLAVLPQAPSAPPPPAASAPAVTRLGPEHAYGAGIAAVQDDAILVELASAGHVILVRVDEDGSIQPVYPTPEDTSNELPAGRHIVGIQGLHPSVRAAATAAPSYEPVVRSADALARQGRPARPSATGDDPVEPATPVAHWLLIVSDVPTSAADIESLLGAMTHDFPSMKAELDQVARVLTNRRTRHWAAFYAPVQTP